MSTGHRRGEAKPDAELYHVLGEGDTAELYARPVHIDTDHDIPYAGGNSVDGKIVYIDRRLYIEVMQGTVAVRGMTGKQIIQAWIEHEHPEWAIEAGDNPADNYDACHGYATAKEERFVKQLGVDPELYEAAIKDALKRCVVRRPVNPPQDLWCGPYLDVEFVDMGMGKAADGRRAAEILRIFRLKGVEDAFKRSKIEVHYGLGGDACRDCKHYNHGKSGDFGPCELVCGLVRADRQCDLYEAK